MRWLCDENIPRLLVEALRQHGHDVLWIRDTSPGIADADVLAVAIRERRICLTFDKDFGELATRTAMPAECGVVLLRIPMLPSKDSAAGIALAIDTRSDWPGHFSVIEPGRIRMRRLGT